MELWEISHFELFSENMMIKTEKLQWQRCCFSIILHGEEEISCETVGKAGRLLVFVEWGRNWMKGNYGGILSILLKLNAGKGWDNDHGGSSRKGIGWILDMETKMSFYDGSFSGVCLCGKETQVVTVSLKTRLLSSSSSSSSSSSGRSGSSRSNLRKELKESGGDGDHYHFLAGRRERREVPCGRPNLDHWGCSGVVPLCCFALSCLSWGTFGALRLGRGG